MSDAMSHWRVVVAEKDGSQSLEDPQDDLEWLGIDLQFLALSGRRVLGIWRVTPKLRGERAERQEAALAEMARLDADLLP
jgi:hypothetical protein